MGGVENSGAHRIEQRGSEDVAPPPIQLPMNFCGFHVKNTHFSALFYRKRACNESL